VPAPRRVSSKLPIGVSLRFFLSAVALVPTGAAAQVGVVASVYTDLRFRGYSLSDGRPVGVLDVSYDAPNGIYAAVSGSVVAARHEGPKGLGLALNAGYAKPVGRDLTLDVGVIHSRYSEYSSLASGRIYTEAYVGLAGRFVGTRWSISPNYIGPAHWTLHGEVNGHVNLARDLLLDGTAGVLFPIGGAAYKGAAGAQWDGRIGLAQRVGPVTLHAALTARGKSSDVYVTRRHGRTAAVLGISTAF